MRKFIDVFLAINLLVVSLAFVLFLASQDSRFALATVVLCCPVAMLLPIRLRRDLSPADPIVAVLAYVLIGCVGTGLLLAFGSGPRRTFLMNGEDLLFFIKGGLWVVLALFLFGLGNLASWRLRIEKTVFVTHDWVSPRVLIIVALLALAASVIATMIFLNDTGGFNLATLSKKRGVEMYDQDGNLVFANAGYIRNLAGIGVPVLLILLGTTLKKARRVTFFTGALIALLAIISVAVPFLGSSRSGVAIVFIQIALMTTLFARLSLRTLIVPAAVILLVFPAMTTLRLQGQQRDVSNASSNPFVALASSGNGLSLVATSLIVQRVPERMDYMYGGSLWTWIVQPIPRTVWPQKPNVALSAVIKEQIMHERAGKADGRPPGTIAEGWINFGFVGYMFFAFGFGAVCRGFWETFKPFLGRNVLASALYIVLLPEITIAVNAGFSQVIVRTLTSLVIFGIVFLVLMPRMAPPRTMTTVGNRSLPGPVRRAPGLQ